MGWLKGGGGVGIWRWRCAGTLRVSWKSGTRPEHSLMRSRSNGCCLPGRTMCRRFLAKLAGALRGELTERHRQLEQAVVGATDALGGDATWRKLDSADQGAILDRVGLERPAPLSVETNEALKRTLDSRRLAAWRSEIDAVPERFARALEEAAKRSKGQGPPPVTVKIKPVTLSDEAAVQRWVAEHEEKLTEAVRKGPVIVR